MNQKLNELYKSKWDLLKEKFDIILKDDNLITKPAKPLLLYIDNEYQNADIRLLVFGQETNQWCPEILDMDIDKIQSGYDSWFNGGECWTYGKFYKGIENFIKLLQEKYPNKKIKTVWNNTIKIGIRDGKGCPPDYIYHLERKFFNVTAQELEILQPNLVLFFSGPNYDEILKNNFNELEFDTFLKFSGRQISKVKINNVKFSYRTYHPNYFRYNNKMTQYYKAIIDDLNF